MGKDLTGCFICDKSILIVLCRAALASRVAQTKALSCIQFRAQFTTELDQAGVSISYVPPRPSAAPLLNPEMSPVFSNLCLNPAQPATMPVPRLSSAASSTISRKPSRSSPPIRPSQSQIDPLCSRPRSVPLWS
ncbi:hypothetical protein M0R45_006922 [Rubus argutus]|uniref:Uncharacterized protein n=1 Tax=Rubus argutus TaxID=59490 RepID=A0AAW1YRY0_RUBAR